MAEADPDGAPIQGARAFVGQGRAVEPRPDGNAPAPQEFRNFLTVGPALKGHRHGLVRPGKHPIAQCLQSPGTGHGLAVPSGKDLLRGQRTHQAQPRRQSRRPGHIHGPRLQALRKVLRHGFLPGQRPRAAEQQAAIDAAEERAAQLRRSMQDKLTGQTDLTEQTNRLAQAVSDKKAAQAALSAEKDGALRSVEDLKGLQADMVSDRAERDELAQRYRQANEKAAAEMAQHQAKLAEHSRRADALRQKLEQLAQAKLELEQQRDRHSRDSRQCNDALLNAMQAHAKLQQKLDSSGMEESQILEKLWERYELSHSDAMEQRIELESVPKATRRIAELNREIKSLGTPNIGAIEEFDRVNTRYTYLSEQRSDVEQAKEELLGIIDQITQQMTEIFAQQFQLLNESFQETFLELFGGGKARLELEDENDILNCGIEIKVQPPGKQLKTITLLSGGEKAFVAIALYFAILKVHPTPFCVMDEIEAALDEANVVRYARYMRRIAGKTQFIVITHRRGTMEEADVLYGVTMQEKGVSRILTINLNDMAKELHIK